MDERSYYIRLYEALATPPPGAVEAQRKLGIETEETMQKLYHVYAVDIRSREDEEITVLASSEDIAKIRALGYFAWDFADAEYYDIFVQEIGPVRNAPPKAEAENGSE